MPAQSQASHLGAMLLAARVDSHLAAAQLLQTLEHQLLQWGPEEELVYSPVDLELTLLNNNHRHSSPQVAPRRICLV